MNEWMNEAAFVILHCCLLIQTPNYYQLVKNKMNILLLLLLLLLIHINIMYFAILELSFLPLPHFFTQQHSPEDIYIYIYSIQTRPTRWSRFIFYVTTQATIRNNYRLDKSTTNTICHIALVASRYRNYYRPERGDRNKDASPTNDGKAIVPEGVRQWSRASHVIRTCKQRASIFERRSSLIYQSRTKYDRTAYLNFR